MKTLVFCLCFLGMSFAAMAQADGFFFYSSSTSTFQDYTAEEIGQRAPSSETSDENQFFVGLKDGILVHITDSESQLYMITNIIRENDTYIIETLSGLSGNKYYYYIDDSGRKPVLAMIIDIEDDKMSGVRYNNLKTKVFKPFRQY